MGIATPDWVKLRGGEVKSSLASSTLTVYLNGSPAYLLIPTPARGRFACRITQTINGHRLDLADSVYESEPAALEGGLLRLRDVLGW